MTNRISNFFSAPATARAHCDVPCGIYDPIDAQLAAVTVVRVFDLLAEMAEHDTLSMADQAQLARLVAQKEEHAENAKHEIRVIWGDFIKETHVDTDVYRTINSTEYNRLAWKIGKTEFDAS